MAKLVSSVDPGMDAKSLPAWCLHIGDQATLPPPTSISTGERQRSGSILELVNDEGRNMSGVENNGLVRGERGNTYIHISVESQAAEVTF